MKHDEHTQAQVKIAKRLQIKMLERWEALLDSGDLSATDAGHLMKFLLENGWNVDPARMPQGLRDKVPALDSLDFDSDPTPEELGWDA